jgi:hypothetical protein
MVDGLSTALKPRVYPHSEHKPYDLNGQTKLYPYPPRGFDWQSWVCPLLFAGMMVIVVLWLRRGRSESVRVIGGMAVAIATLWFLLMLPRFQGAREAAPRSQCRNNLKALAVGVHKWHDEHRRLPAPVTSANDEPPVTWRINLLPYLGQADLGTGYDRAKAWTDPANLPVAKRQPRDVYVCLSNKVPHDPQGRWYTAYALLTGAGTPFPAEGPLTLKDISDGTSQTLLLVEACGRNIVWTEPRDVDVSREAVEINAPGTIAGASEGVLSSWHIGGATCALADGSVRFMSQNTSPDVLRALTTAAGEDDPGEF